MPSLSDHVHPTGPRLERGTGVPLWRQLLADLSGRLDAGEFESAFPGELAIRDEYGVSRQTVREALRHLREAGAVTAARGRSPKVAAPVEIEQPLGALYSLFTAVEAAGLAQLSIVRVLDLRADGVVAHRLDLEESTPLLHLERLRLAGDEPLAIDRVWLPARIAAPLLDADFTRTGLYEELARRCGVRLTSGREVLRAVVPSPNERRLLSIDDRTAAFSVDRLGRVDGTAIEWRHTLVRGDRFRVTAEFSGRHGYRMALDTPHLPTRRP